MWQVAFIILLCAAGTSTIRKDMRTEDLLINFVRDTLRDISRDFNKTDDIRQNSRMSASFEIGFVIRSMEECYRRMVDIYNSTLTTDLNGWGAKTTDNIVFLKNVEVLHWVLQHLSKMLHEIEKKYKIKEAGMFEKQRIWTIAALGYTTSQRRKHTTEPVSVPTMTKRRTQSWWPIDYGWERSINWR